MNGFKGVFFSLSFLASAVLAPLFLAQANDSLEVKSVLSGQNIYEVVFESKNKSTTEDQPGIYSIHRNGSQTPVVLGTVLGVSKGFNGILGQSTYVGTLDTADSLAVVDKKLVLFNKNSSERVRSKKPFILGEGQFKAFDPILGIDYSSSIRIENLDDVVIRSFSSIDFLQLRGGGSLFLVSIKQKNLFGDGLTLAFFLENTKTDSQTPKVYKDKAVIIGYNFLDEEALATLTLVQENNLWTGELYSPNLVKSTLQKIKEESGDPLLGRWVGHLKKAARALGNPKLIYQYQDNDLRHLLIGTPTFNLIQEKVVYKGIPAKSLIGGETSLYQIYDPRTSLWSVIEAHQSHVESATPSKDVNLAPVKGSKKASNLDFIDSKRVDESYLSHGGVFSVLGRVNYNKQKQYKVQTLAPRKGGNFPEYLVHIGDSSLVLLRDKQNTKRVVKINENLWDARSVEVVHLKRGLKAEEERHFLFFSVISKTGKKSLIVLTLKEEDKEFKVLSRTPLINNSMSREEILLRAVSREKKNSGIYFDTRSPVKGAIYYRKTFSRKGPLDLDENGREEKDEKTTPYVFLPDNEKSEKKAKMAFLTASRIIDVDRGAVKFIQFGSEKVEESSPKATGFYLDAEKNLDLQKNKNRLRKPVFLDDFQGRRVLGKPLDVAFSIHSSKKKLGEQEGKEKIESLGRASIVAAKDTLPIDLYAVPFLPNVKSDPSKQKKFHLLVAASSPDYEEPQTQVTTIEVPASFDDLIGMEILQGLRHKEDHFHILLFFGKNRLGTQGVYSFSGKIEVDKTGSKDSYNLLDVNPGMWIHSDRVSATEVKMRIKADTKGNFYWIENLGEGRDSTKLRGYDLSQKKQLIYFNRNSSDREEEGGIELRFDEELDRTTEGKNMLYSEWELGGRVDQVKRFNWFREYKNALVSQEGEKLSQKKWFDLHKRSSASFFHFLESLGRLRPKGVDPKRQVVLVEDRMKEAFLKDMMVQLSDTGKSFSLYQKKKEGEDLGGERFSFFEYQVTSTLEEGQKEMEGLIDRSKVQPTLLYNTIDKINLSNPLIRGDSGESKKGERLSRWLFLATDGQRFDISRLRHKIKNNRPPQVPMLFVGTPKEWNDVIEAHPEEHRKGVFDNFEINSEFLTSTWTLWPPGSEHATKSVKNYAKTPVTEEEYGVFPDLEDIFVGAAQGEFKGKQKVLIVSEELKPLIHKLIMARWATSSEKSMGEWHHNNKDLSVYQLQGSKKDNSQAQVFENFQAMRGGAKNSHVVFYSDLEQVLNLGRPFNQEGKNYQLKEPLIPSDKAVLRGILNPNQGAQAQESLAQPRRDQLGLSEKEREMRGGEEEEDYENTLRLKQEDVKEIARVREFKELQLSEKQEESERLESQEQGALSKRESQKFQTLMSQLEGEVYSLYEEINDLKGQEEVIKDEISELMELISRSRENINEQEGVRTAHQPRVSEARFGESQVMPHLMWLLASEGQKVQPKLSRNWSLDEAVKKQYATILLGTEQEWNQIEQDLGSFEGKYLDISKHFDVVKLRAPEEEVKVKLVESLFSRPEIESMEYSFEIEGQSQADAKRQLIYHFVNRVEQVAIQQEVESTTAFIKAFSEFKYTLIEDLSLRRRRVIDKNLLERLLFKVFPLPISIENLEPEDPLQKVSKSVTEAARQLQKLGYHGSMDLKVRTFDTLLNQTRGSDGGRPIPNSQIYFGGTSSGKTYLFKKKVEYLGLTEYDPLKASNEEADYIVIPIQNLVEEDDDESGKLTVDKAIEMVEDLLSQPKGHRAFILFDDAHKTRSSKVHQKLFSFIQGFFEAPNGVVRVKKKDSNEYKEVPVQNLNLYMTVNPTANKEQRDRYSQGNDLNKLVLAALANHNQDMEDSVLSRWSDIIDLDKFPRGAKVPALVESIRGQSKTSSSTVLVSSGAIDAIVNKFPDANAREFLTPAASALTHIPPSAERSSLYLVTERDQEGSSALALGSKGFLKSNDLREAVKGLTEVNAVRLNDPSSVLKLVDFLMSNFRMQAFNHMVLSVQNTNTLKLDAPGQTTVVQRNYISALMAHLFRNPRLPISELRVSGSEFSYLDKFGLEELVEIQQKQRRNKKENYFPFTIGSQKHFSAFHSQGFMESETLVHHRPKSRQDVFADMVKEIEQVFRQMLRLYTRLPRTLTLKDTLTWDESDRKLWFESLKQEDEITAYKKLSNRLLVLYTQFVEEFYRSDLIEMKSDQQASFTIYDQVRMFAFLVDKAITQLPWGLMSKFVLDVMDSASGDLSLGQKPYFIKYAYSHQVSPFSIQTSDFLNDTFSGQTKDKTRLEAQDKNFVGSCSLFLGGEGP